MNSRWSSEKRRTRAGEYALCRAKNGLRDPRERAKWLRAKGSLNISGQGHDGLKARATHVRPEQNPIARRYSSRFRLEKLQFSLLGG